jgi:vitamin B12 transporter
MNKKFIRFSAIALLFTMSTYAQEQEPEKLNVVISDSKFSCQKKNQEKLLKFQLKS